ncbi:helix-turn-helix transcriptional regulator [Dyadobacter bucti]|uniref:helix-turn-helix transcriptional regulator n=1 Tax=Dyadobacter bucti TaxID=2572203 RepID=UPI003F6FD8F5
MDLTEKIKQILAEKNLSPSLFADEIGIQRSSMSHILAGRNKPSLDIVQKIMRRFPELGQNWILEDENVASGPLPATGSKPVDLPLFNPAKSTTSRSADLNRKKDPINSRAQENVNPDKTEIKEEKKIERILVFYSDGTFQEFKQTSFQ